MAGRGKHRELVFQFQQFAVRHDHAAMKVGTDGVLLGSWAGTDSPDAVLDIGTGSGLIALMLAQRFPAAKIDAVEIDHGALIDASLNFAESPWCDRLALFSGDVRTTPLPRRYSLIVSNPPWYDSEMRPPEEARSLARHSDGLPVEELVSVASSYLTENGRFAVILPVEKSERFLIAARSVELVPIRRTDVRPNPSKPAHRLLLEMIRQPQALANELSVDQLTIESTQRHEYSIEFQNLVRGFYLRFR